jgi:hypothetical protein
LRDASVLKDRFRRVAHIVDDDVAPGGPQRLDITRHGGLTSVARGKEERCPGGEVVHDLEHRSPFPRSAAAAGEDRNRTDVASALHRGQAVDAVRNHSDLFSCAIDSESASRLCGAMRDVTLRGGHLVHPGFGCLFDTRDLRRRRHRLESVQRHPCPNRSVLWKAAHHLPAETRDRFEGARHLLRGHINQRPTLGVGAHCAPQRRDTRRHRFTAALLGGVDEMRSELLLCRRSPRLFLQECLDQLQGLGIDALRQGGRTFSPTKQPQKDHTGTRPGSAGGASHQHRMERLFGSARHPPA